VKFPIGGSLELQGARKRSFVRRKSAELVKPVPTVKVWMEEDEAVANFIL
jgi:hypothetical protein